MTNSAPGEFASSGIRVNEKGKERVLHAKEKVSRVRRGFQEPGEGCGNDAGITDGRGQ